MSQVSNFYVKKVSRGPALRVVKKDPDGGILSDTVCNPESFVECVLNDPREVIEIRLAEGASALAKKVEGPKEGKQTEPAKTEEPNEEAAGDVVRVGGNAPEVQNVTPTENSDPNKISIPAG